ncbi:Hepatic leukemia factor, partial [Ophiophagus hannah]
MCHSCSIRKRDEQMSIWMEKELYKWIPTFLTIPGQEIFDPRKRKFSEEELKPQPMIKKARKVFIPEDLKDDKYWARRRKNNMAAKRSRDARRLKENQIAIRASFLEKENTALRQEVADLRKELGKCKNVLVKYEARHGPL